MGHKDAGPDSGQDASPPWEVECELPEEVEARETEARLETLATMRRLIDEPDAHPLKRAMVAQYDRRADSLVARFDGFVRSSFYILDGGRS